jgi:hypothetical protein
MSYIQLCDICGEHLDIYPVYGFRERFKLFKRTPKYDFVSAEELKTNIDFCDNCFREFVAFVRKKNNYEPGKPAGKKR